MKRGKLEQIIDFLGACRKDANTTSVMTAANLNMTEFGSLVELLQEEGYLECYPAKPKSPPSRRKYAVYNRVRYRLTEKGMLLLKSSAPLLELKQKLYPPKRTLNAISVI